MRTFIVTLLILLVSFSSASQDRKAERKARRAERREIRLLEKAVRDSIYLREYERDSINVGYGYVRRPLPVLPIIPMWAPLISVTATNKTLPQAIFS